jgi:hypothetical protein
VAHPVVLLVLVLAELSVHSSSMLGACEVGWGAAAVLAAMEVPVAAWGAGVGLRGAGNGVDVWNAAGLDVSCSGHGCSSTSKSSTAAEVHHANGLHAARQQPKKQPQQLIVIATWRETSRQQTT